MIKPQKQPGKARARIYVALSALVCGGVFAYLFRHVPPREVYELLRGADERGVWMFVALSMAGSVFRTWRYRLLLRTSGFDPGAAVLFLVVLVRNFLSDLLPARIGTLAYVYIVTGRLGVPFPAAASSFALAFLFDLVALVPLLALASLYAAAGSGLSPTLLLAGGLALLVVLVLILHALPRLGAAAGSCVERLPGLGAERRKHWGQAVSDVGTDIARIQEAGLYPRLLALSLLVRVCKYASLYVFLYALVAPLGFTWARLEIPKVLLGLCSSEFAASLPVSGLAGFGAYEGTWVVVFRLLGFPLDIARGTSISHHLFTQVYGYGLGAVALLILLLPCFGRTRAPACAAGKEHAFSFYGKLLVLAAGTAALAAAAYTIPSLVSTGPVGP